VTSPYIFETNRMAKTPTSQQWFFSYYKKMFVYLRNRKNLKLNSQLGFDSHGIYRIDDTWIHEHVLIESLENLLLDKLYTHEQKKLI
jgi:hypothetical protein